MLGLCGLLLAGSLPLAAQASGTRDPIELAGRLLGVHIPYVILEPAPVFPPGQKLTLWVNKKGRDAPVRTTATLASSTAYLEAVFNAAFPSDVEIWVEDGLPYEPGQLDQLTSQAANVLDQIRSAWFLGANTGFDPRLPMPDIDNDQTLAILFAAGIDDSRDAFYNPNNSLVFVYVPGQTGNQRDLIIVNTSKYPGVTLDNPLYTSILVQAMYDALTVFYVPDQTEWLRSALRTWFFANQIELTGGPAASIDAFLQAPNNVPLTRAAASDEATGLQQLFFEYLGQRIGPDRIASLFTASGDGLAPLDAVLAREGLIDPITQQPVTARSLFADFVMATAVNRPSGDLRYYQTTSTIEQGQTAAALGLGDLNDLVGGTFSLSGALQAQTGGGAVVSQFGSVYVRGGASVPLVITLGFGGAESVSRLPMPADESRLNHFYWSGRGRNRDHTLTRMLDLSRADRATLTFDAWYRLANLWSYAYVEVSADGGETWDILPATSTTPGNPNALAYGPGFTGISNSEKPRAFPFLGITFDPATGAINEIVSDGPVANTAARPGDVVIGYDGQPWPGGVVDFIGLLANYNAGDTLNLYVQRGAETFDVPVVLGEHPVRRFVPEPVWMRQEVDLSAYAGRTILLRFEYISLPDQMDDGIAIDNLAVPEIDFRDDAETESADWTMLGWQRIDNDVPQRYLVQAAILDAESFPVTVRQLIGPDDDATAGEWRLRLEANQELVIAVSGLNDDTTSVAQFDLLIEAEPPAQG